MQTLTQLLAIEDSLAAHTLLESERVLALAPLPVPLDSHGSDAHSSSGNNYRYGSCVRLLVTSQARVLVAHAHGTVSAHAAMQSVRLLLPISLFSLPLRSFHH